VRANSILRKFKQRVPKEIVIQHELDESEIDLIDRISQFPDAVQKAAAEFKTLHITNQAYEMARAFNNFYNQAPVLQAEENVRNFRIRLVASAKEAIANSLRLLGIEAPEVM